MNGGGYGICGHKNAYNAGVKDGNWVEDKVGQDLAANRPRPKQTTISEQKSNYIHPADMPQKHATGPTYVDSQSRKGLNRDVLFNHGPDIFGSQEKVPSSSAGKELLRTRSNTLNQEQYQVDFRSSEARSANTQIPEVEFRVRGPSKPVALPVFHRNSTFSRGELLDR